MPNWDKMKRGLIIGFILVYSLSACIFSTSHTAPSVEIQPTMDSTPEDFTMQTIIAREQITDTPATIPTNLSNLPKPWTEIIPPTPYLSPIIGPAINPNPAIATAPRSNNIIYQGPGTMYKMACYVGEGTQLIITGRNFDSSWLNVILGQKQTCITMDGRIIRANVIQDPTIQFWILYSSYNISGDLSEIPIFNP